MRRPPTAIEIKSTTYASLRLFGQPAERRVSGVVRGGYYYTHDSLVGVWFYTNDGYGSYRVPLEDTDPVE